MERLEELDRQFGQYSKEQEEDYQRNLRGIQDNTFGISLVVLAVWQRAA